MPQLTVISGPNGSGKTSARRMNPEDIQRAAVSAGREVIRRTKEYLDAGVSFAIETTLSSSSIIETMRAARERGFIVYLIYVCLDTPDLNIQRVGERDSRGGHDVPPAADVRRRYERSVMNLGAALAIAHEARVYDNSREQPRKVLEARNGSIVWRSADQPAWVIASGFLN